MDAVVEKFWKQSVIRSGKERQEGDWSQANHSSDLLLLPRGMENRPVRSCTSCDCSRSESVPVEAPLLWPSEAESRGKETAVIWRGRRREKAGRCYPGLLFSRGLEGPLGSLQSRKPCSGLHGGAKAVNTKVSGSVTLP